MPATALAQARAKVARAGRAPRGGAGPASDAPRRLTPLSRPTPPMKAARSASSALVGGLRAPLRHPDHAGLDQLEAVEEAWPARPRLADAQRAVGALVDPLGLGSLLLAAAVVAGLREHQVAARRQRLAQRGAAIAGRIVRRG